MYLLGQKPVRPFGARWKVFLSLEEILLPPHKLSPKLPQYPIALVHGMGGDKPFLRYYRTINEDLHSLGVQYVQPQVHRYGIVEKRAAQLEEQLLTFLKQNKSVKKLNLIAHSMGGLDSRYLISKLGGNEYIASLTTIGTPHHGSSYCDFCVDKAISPLKLENIIQLFDFEYGAWNNLTTRYLKDFNINIRDDPAIKYYSIAGDALISKTNILYLPYQYIRRAEGPNDGLVSVSSATYGDFLGTVPFDHAQQIGWSFLDSRYFYRYIVNFLAEQGH